MATALSHPKIDQFQTFLIGQSKTEFELAEGAMVEVNALQEKELRDVDRVFCFVDLAMIIHQRGKLSEARASLGY